MPRLPKRRTGTDFTPLQSRIMSDRLRALSEQVVAVSLVSPLGLGCAAYAMLGVVPRERVILWLIIAGLAHATAIALGLIYLRRPRSPAENGRWIHLFTVRALLTGASWGASTVIMWPTDRFEYQAVLVMFLVGFSTISTLTNSALRRCVVASALGTWVPAIWRMATSSDPLHQTIAIMLLTFTVIILASMLRFSRQLLEATRWRFENAELAENLQIEQRRVDAANRSKSRFLAAASHDLRQPVHALGFFLQTLRLTAERPQPERAKLIEVARQAQGTLNGLTGLLDTLLDFSRLEAGTVPADLQPIPIKPVLVTLAQQFTERARRKGLKLRVRPCVLSVRSNPVGLQRILGNLVENAIRYSDRGGVLVGCRTRGNQLLIQVWDTGQGIPPDELGEIFEEFYQVNAPPPKPGSEHGLGLGLSIVKQLADLLGHQVTVYSRVGKGSRFTVTVPLCDSEVENPTLGPLTLSAFSPAVAGYLLVIDDDDDSLDSQRELLEQVGYRVLIARSADEALAFAPVKSRQIAAIIADYRLAHNRTGIEAIELISREHGRPIPAMIVTGDTDPERIEQLSHCGYPVEHKPLAPRTFLRKVRQLVNRPRE
ncbi:MAG: ATP-binding protein [Candidatus Methylophosphatis roskildensis]